MQTVGIRELKNRLSEYIRQARSGERLLVTDRGVVVAELRKPSEPLMAEEAYPELSRAIRDGRVSPASKNRPDRYPHLDPLLPPGRGLELLDAERGEH